ncbi:MAG: NUDIX domain-containing protein [Halodesulfurarchaeum sp.]
MDPTEVVTVFLRNDAEVLLFRRSDAVGSYPGHWGTVAGHAEGDPDEMARREIEEETGLDREEVRIVRRGDPFVVEDDRESPWSVTPYLFDVETRKIEPNWETSEYEWAPPTELLHRETVPQLWTSYDRVRPGVDSVAADTEHGSAVISIRALEVLRDEAGLAGARDGNWSSVESTAIELLEARPEMAAVANRVHRVMYRGADQETPEAVHDAAIAVLDEALHADESAAERAADVISGKRVVTLSRSGTVEMALRSGNPAHVVVAASRPGGEGIGVAETLYEAGLAVSLTSDANLPAVIRRADVVLVGADTVFRDGDVRNKVGTTSAMLAGEYHGTDRYVVCAQDKIHPADDPPDSPTDTAVADDDSDKRNAGPDTGADLGDPVYDGDRPIEVNDPIFERVPGDLITGIVTESGILDRSDVTAVARELESLRQWRER